MKVTVNWLKQYVDFDWTPAELADRLTQLGLEVEGIETVAGEFPGIVVGQVLSRDKVAGSDKLSVCRVRDGKGERQVICGAQNYKVGDKVPLILPNFSLPLKPGEKEPFTIKVRKVMGVESHGMLCSPGELGLPDEVDGLLILREEAIVGQPFAEYLGRSQGDTVLDLEITPNRPDLNSVIGIAREIAAVSGAPLKLPALDIASERVAAGEKAADWVSVRNEAAELCPRYTARVLRGVEVGPSPKWLRELLERVGVRSINNVVDATNFVMLETGQPLHAFDYHLLAKGAAGRPEIVVRRAADGERFTTLDGQERTLTREMLLIADPEKGIALAGIMGGQNTEIRETTRDVLIESAYFAPTPVRRTSKALGLRTDASYRFERGADVAASDAASRRVAQLILGMTRGSALDGVVDEYSAPAAPRVIRLRHRKVGELLGMEVGSAESEAHLARLGLEKTGASDGAVEFLAPSWRVDLKQEVDLIEEVARLHGVEKIPATAPRGGVGRHAFDATYDVLMEVRRLLSGLGWDEAQGQTLIASEAAAVAIEPGLGAETVVAPLANPLSSEMDALRPSLIPGLLDTLRHNAHRRNDDVAVFELGRVFRRTSAGGVSEGWRLALACTGVREGVFWAGAERDARIDWHDLKGALEAVLEAFGLRGVVFERRAEPTALYLESAVLKLGGKMEFGQGGQLLPALARRNDLKSAVFAAEVNLEFLLSKRNAARSYKPLPAFPSARRDVALLVPEQTTHDAIRGVVQKAGAANLESVELFDVFRGQGVPAGQKSVAYALTYRAADRTLTDAEVNAAHGKILAALQSGLGATLR